MLRGKGLSCRFGAAQRGLSCFHYTPQKNILTKTAKAPGAVPHLQNGAGGFCRSSSLPWGKSYLFSRDRKLVPFWGALLWK